jgi:hypothetical protein
MPPCDSPPEKVAGIADGRSEYPVSRRMRIAGRENVKRTNPEAESHEF